MASETTLTGGQLLTENQVAQYLNVSPRSLQGWRYQGGGPPYISISSRAVRYRAADLESWVDASPLTKIDPPLLSKIDPSLRLRELIPHII